MSKRFGSVSEMLGNQPDGEALKQRFDEESAKKTLARALFLLRHTQELTQDEVAVKMGVTQSAVSRIEHTANENMRVDDLQKYAAALGYRISVGIHPKSITESVKFHAFEIRRYLLHLADLSHGDTTMEAAAAEFFGESIFNLMKFVDAAASKIDASIPIPDDILEVFTATPEELGSAEAEPAPQLPAPKQETARKSAPKRSPSRRKPLQVT